MPDSGILIADSHRWDGEPENGYAVCGVCGARENSERARGQCSAERFFQTMKFAHKLKDFLKRMGVFGD